MIVLRAIRRPLFLCPLHSKSIHTYVHTHRHLPLPVHTQQMMKARALSNAGVFFARYEPMLFCVRMLYLNIGNKNNLFLLVAIFIEAAC